MVRTADGADRQVRGGHAFGGVFIASVAMVAAALLPVGEIGGAGATLVGAGGVIALDAVVYLVLAMAALALGMALDPRGAGSGALIAGAGTTLGLLLLRKVWAGLDLAADFGFWVVLALVVFLVWTGMSRLAQQRTNLTRVLVPLLFGGLIVYLWELTFVGFGVPPVIIPPPTDILEAIIAHRALLWLDFQHTIAHSALIGFAIGCSAGFLVAVLIDRSSFLQRGLLPIGSAVSAMPIVGTAPILISWFGQGWPASSAVVVIMTFFPMLVNTLAGLRSTGAMERDLMHSYAASYSQTLWRLRLPMALPFMFNALKLNSTLALIGAIVSEFFGSPIVGMGFRIVSEQQRLNLDVVWATIAVAAVVGSLSYGVLTIAERVATFWHPSQRGEG
ncbi:MAG: ABC transporter permease [Azospirillaceae bacterium]